MTDTQTTPGLYAITCESGPPCRAVYRGDGSYSDAWRAAYAAGWRADLSGVRRCDACVAERQPVITMWLPAEALAGYLAAKIPPPEGLDGQRTEVVLVTPALSLAAREATTDAPPEPDDPAPVLNPVAEGALKRFEQAHAEEGEREATATIPAQAQITEAMPAVTDEGGTA